MELFYNLIVDQFEIYIYNLFPFFGEQIIFFEEKIQ